MDSLFVTGTFRVNVEVISALQNFCLGRLTERIDMTLSFFENTSK